MIAGIAMTILASKTELAWNWDIYEWNDEIEYYGWIDRVGQLGIVYFLTGITWAIGEADLDQFLWAVWAAFLSGIAIQGFRDETETPWRRGFGSMGSIFSLFMLSFTFDTELYTYVTWMFLGVVALGFGFAYISRLGEVSTIFSEDYSEVQEAVIDQQKGEGLSYVEPIPKPVHSEEDMEDDSEESDDAEELDEVIDIQEDDPEEANSLLDKAINDTIDKKTGDVKDKKKSEKRKEEESSSKETNEADISALPYDLILDPSISEAIQNSLNNTPHEGFKPIVSVSQNGTLKIDFVPI
jgi:hypothetical protein